MNNVDFNLFRGQALTGSNFTAWYQRTKNILYAFGLKDYIDRNVIATLLTNEATTEQQIANAQINNAKALGIIYGSIDDKIANYLIGLETAFEVMEKLKTLFKEDKDTNLEVWLGRIKKLKARNTKEIIKTLNQMMELFRLMETTNHQLTEENKMQYIYNSLPNTVRDIIILSTQNNTAQELFDSIKEKVKVMNRADDIGIIRNVRTDDDKMDIDHINNLNKRNIRNHKENKFKNNKFCDICKKNGHYSENCFYNTRNIKIRNYNKNNRKNYKNNKNNKKYYDTKNKIGNLEYSNQEADVYNYEENFTLDELRPLLEQKYEEINNNDITEWTYDTGATAHVTNNKNILKNFKKEKIKMICANNTKCTFEGYGTYEGYINKHKITLRKVYFSKQLNKNLISGLKFSNTGLESIIKNENNKTYLIIKNKYNKIIYKTYPKHNNNFTLYTKNLNKENLNYNNNYFYLKNYNKLQLLDKNSEDLWHRRLGHYFQPNLENYLKQYNTDINDNNCDNCNISKIKRKPHNKTPPRAKRINEIIHSDIMGPLPTSINNKKYILTFIDDYSRHSWVYLLNNKGEAPKVIIEALKFINNQNDNKIKIFKSDNGKEYLNKKVINFCKNNGINKLYSPPYNPQNNGIAERFNQTIISSTRTLLNWSKLSQNFWNFAVKYANYIYNYIPHSGINNRVPYEVYFNQKPNLSHIKVFGCICFYKIFDLNKNKLLPNSKRGVFLGFSTKANAYIIMDYNKLSIHLVREVYFKENLPAELYISNSEKRITEPYEFKDNIKNDNINKFNKSNNNVFPTKDKNLNFNYLHPDNNQDDSNNLINYNSDIHNFNKSNIKNTDNKYSETKNNFEDKNIKFNNEVVIESDEFNNNNNNSETVKTKSYLNNTDNEGNILNYNNINPNIEHNNFKNNDNNISYHSENNFNNQYINNNNNLNNDIYDNTYVKIDDNNSYIQQNNPSASSKNSKIQISNNNTDFTNSKLFSKNIDKNLFSINDNKNFTPENNLFPVTNKNSENLINPNKLNPESNLIYIKPTIKSNNQKPYSYVNNSYSNNFELNSNNNINTNNDNNYNNNNNFNNNINNNINNNNNNNIIKNNNNTNNINHKIIKVNNINDYEFDDKIYVDNNIIFINKKPLYKNYTVNNKNIYDNLVIASVNTKTPTTYNDAINDENSYQWILAIKDELKNLYENETFEFVQNLPKDSNLVSTKWIFSIKYDENNNIKKFKARLVARGFSQKYGIDYELTYSPTLDIDAIKLILALASKFKWLIYQLDIKSAYLNAPLDIPIYAKIPQGDKNYKKGFWLLKKSLYGLKQSGRQWNDFISRFLISIKYNPLNSEKCMFRKYDSNNNVICIIGLYVDDMIIAGTRSEIINVIYKIRSHFKISNCQPINYLLGIKIYSDNYNYSISQKHVIQNLTEQFNLTESRTRKTPCTGDNSISENNTPFNCTLYKSLIGSLIYLAKCSRPDISYAVHKAARHCEHPTITDYHKALNIIKYLKYTIDFKIIYNGEGEILAYCDADFAGDKDDRKSTSGNIILMGNSAISWTSKKQSTVATSTAEAEYISTSECTKKILWIRNILKELFNFDKPITIYTDNLASKKSIENGELNTKLKHISVKFHFNRDNILKNKIKLEYIDTNNMLADILTKETNSSKIKEFTDKIFNNKK